MRGIGSPYLASFLLHFSSKRTPPGDRPMAHWNPYFRGLRPLVLVEEDGFMLFILLTLQPMRNLNVVLPIADFVFRTRLARAPSRGR